MSETYNYGQVSAAIAGLLNVRSDARTKLDARLRHFLRLGWPEGLNTKRGQARSFTLEQALDLALAAEMNVGDGLKPEHAIRVIRAKRVSLHREAEAGRTFVFRPIGALAPLSDDPDNYRAPHSLTIWNVGAVKSRLAELLGA